MPAVPRMSITLGNCESNESPVRRAISLSCRSSFHETRQRMTLMAKQVHQSVLSIDPPYVWTGVGYRNYVLLSRKRKPAERVSRGGLDCPLRVQVHARKLPHFLEELKHFPGCPWVGLLQLLDDCIDVFNKSLLSMAGDCFVYRCCARWSWDTQDDPLVPNGNSK